MREKGEIVEKMSNFSRKAGRVVFLEPFWDALDPLDRFWDTFWSLWATLVTKSLPEVARRLPKGRVEILKLPRRDPFWERFCGGAVFCGFKKNLKKQYLKNTY